MTFEKMKGRWFVWPSEISNEYMELISFPASQLVQCSSLQNVLRDLLLTMKEKKQGLMWRTTRMSAEEQELRLLGRKHCMLPLNSLIL